MTHSASHNSTSTLPSVAVSRRRFLQKAGMAAAAGAVFPALLPARADARDTRDARDKNNTTGLPRFAVISDIHFGSFHGGLLPEIKVSRALKNILGKGRIDALFVVGDLTQSGKEHEYNSLLKVFSNKANIPDGLPVYFMMGNHDHFNKSLDTAKLYASKLKQPLHQYAEIKGYPFITISPAGRERNDYDAGAKKFLSEKLASAAKKFPGKPVFVFIHHPPANTCYGTINGDDWGSDSMLPILERFPQAIVVSGHSHYPIGDPRSIHQGKFTTVNDGGTAYTEVQKGEIHEKNNHPEGFDNVTEGLIVNVLRNGNVEIERWDTFRNEEILPRWTVSAPHDGSRFIYNQKDKQAPVFAAGSKPVVSDILAGGCVVAFPQAADNQIVHNYLIELLDGEKVIRSVKKCSQFYLNSWMPGELYVVFSKLPVDKTLVARVSAFDSYKNKSAPIQSEPFVFPKTKKG